MPGKKVAPMPSGAAQTDKGRGNTARFPVPGMKIYRVGGGSPMPNDATINGLERRAPANRSKLLRSN